MTRNSRTAKSTKKAVKLRSDKLKREFDNRFARESASFDRIARERSRKGVIPDMRAAFKNFYFYNNIWRDSLFLQQEYGPLCRWVILSLKSAGVKKVIELGCGNGWFSLELAREGFDVTGLDLSDEQIRFAENYRDSLQEAPNLRLRYIRKNILEFDEYDGCSIVCFGFLHHLPPPVLKAMAKSIATRMKKGQVLAAIEPRYDHSSEWTALLIYALRRVMPNHFRYSSGKKSELLKYVQEIFDDLSESRKDQSEMDRESDSDLIIKTLRSCFRSVETSGATAFYDKYIGSARLESDKDTERLAICLKELDNLIVKHNPDCARNVKILAQA